MTLLLPAPRIAGLLPAVCPRCIPLAVLDYRTLPEPRIVISTRRGSFALTDETRLGETLVELDTPRRAG